MSKTYIRVPTLRTHHVSTERSATWLELFYDLVFVVAVAALGKRLLDDTDLAGFLAFVGVFVPLWWAWASYTFYADRFDTDDAVQRLLAVFQMVAVAMMAVSLTDDVARSTRAFAASYIAARVVLLLMYLRARIHVEATRVLVTGYMRGFTIEIVFWLGSLVVPEPWRFVLWAIGLTISLATPYYYREEQKKVPLDTSHLPERYGLFTILVLGESIAAVVASLSHEGWAPEATSVGVIGVLIAAGLWWLYFDNLEGTVVRRSLARKRDIRPTVWIFSHLPLSMGLIAAGIGVEFIVAHTDEVLPLAERWITLGGAAIALSAMAAIHLATVSDDVLRRDKLRAGIRLVSVAMLIVVALTVSGPTSTPVAVVLFVILAVQVAMDILISEQAAAAHRGGRPGKTPR